MVPHIYALGTDMKHELAGEIGHDCRRMQKWVVGNNRTTIYKAGSRWGVCIQVHPPIYSKFSLSKMFIQSIQNDRGTAWDRQYQPLGVSFLPPAVDLRYKLNNAGIEIYTQVHFSLNPAPFPMHIISNTTACDYRETSIHAQPMHSVPRGDTRKPSSILALHHLDSSCTITNVWLKELHPKIPARLSAMDVDRLSRLEFAPSLRGLMTRGLRPYNLLQTPTAKPKGM
jgi:hypothetical protein